MNIIGKGNVKYILNRIKRKGFLNLISGMNRKYIKSNYINIFLSKLISKNSMELDFPNVIQIETRSGCNYNCSFCPTNKVKMKQGKMQQELFDKIIKQLNRYNGYVSLFFRNEPLMDKRIISWAKKIKTETMAKVIIQTNGSLLTEEIARELIQYADILVNDYTKEKKVENKIVKWERDISDRIIIVERNNDEVLTNRAGNIKGCGRTELNNSCVKPFTELTITFSGTVVLCCQDWMEEAVIGDVNYQSIREIWHSKKLNEIRNQLRKGNRVGICKKCDFIGV
ncbi:radical SAM/SPASM domain-containing protein [Brenneria tiliae]|uniref:SPASM domain-containing protein n=1 Tax=Brenneria tiliae TaxID=2914984 RepID=A0ABT0MNK9_9GAMM|nr:radical SAM/SPASM domain-containing protein [Brenneria tiliae]MCL2891415.1 SPASM domain-containing protein [Brenneria tiliae]